MTIRDVSVLWSNSDAYYEECKRIFSSANQIIEITNEYQDQATRTEGFDVRLAGLGVRASRLLEKVEVATNDAKDTVNASSERDRQYLEKKEIHLYLENLKRFLEKNGGKLL